MVEYKTYATTGKYVIEFTLDSFEQYCEVDALCKEIIKFRIEPTYMSEGDSQTNFEEDWS